MSKTQKSIQKSTEKTQERKVAITVSHLSKTFKLPTERSFGLKQVIFNHLRGIKGYTEQQVLNDVSFKVYDGEFLGIVGRNGSGKSTLLKLLSQIYTPTKGKIEIDGSLVPFIELGVGFNPELTGRENVYLNGAMLGFSNQEMDAMYDDIVNFAELPEFMDQKLKNYSSGMQVRLAFSIAIRARGDILILDEVLAVGDAAFQKKCNDYFASLHGKQTVILVTHSMENVMAYCDRAILIEKGKIIEEGEPAKVTEAYLKLFNLNS
jgi:O-antigen ABC exporter, ATP-binding protein